MNGQVGNSLPPIRRRTRQSPNCKIRTQTQIIGNKFAFPSTQPIHRAGVVKQRPLIRGNCNEGRLSLRLPSSQFGAMGSRHEYDEAKRKTAIAGWRSELSEVEVWYASYGSNMWMPRLLCYITGGKVDGMSAPCCGAHDKSAPKDVIWKTVPHRLFFAGSAHHYWGVGGCAYLYPRSDPNEQSHVCLYKITLEQFNDILFQENYLFEDDNAILKIASPLINLSDLETLSKNKSLIIEALKSCWYNNIVQLGTEENIPILTLTCALTDIDQMKSGGLPMSPPSAKYVNILIKGLVEGKRLTEAEAMDYINAAASREL